MYLKYLELFSTIVSLLSLWLGIKQRIATWPISITITVLNLLIYHQGALYDRWLIGGISIIFSLYGWRQWLYGGTKHTLLKKITKTPFVSRLAIISFSIVCMAIISRILIYLHAALPYWGALCSTLVMVGLWMSGNKKLESYLIWSLLNIVSIYIHYIEGYYWFSTKYVIYLFSAIYGYYEWRNIYLMNKKEA